MNISFIIPAFNCKETISESVRSVYNNNFQAGDQTIIVNDASNDSTDMVIRALSKKFPQLTVIQHKINKGGGAARNTAIENSSNPLIFCLDSDNVLLPGSVNYLRNSIRISHSEVASFRNINYFTKNTSHILKKLVFAHTVYDKNNYLSTNMNPGSSGNILFTKKSWLKVGGYPIYMGALDTWGFGLKLVMAGYSIYCIDNLFYFHRVGHDSYWMRESRVNNHSLVAFQLLVNYLDELNEQDKKYLLNSKNIASWFDNLDVRPLRLNTYKKDRLFGRIKNLFETYLK